MLNIQHCSIAVVFDWGKVVKPRWLLIVRGVIESPFWGWHLHGVRFGVTKLPQVMLAVGHCFLDILHHDVILSWNKVVVDPAGRFGGSLVMPVDTFIVTAPDSIPLPVIPVWVGGSGPPGVPVRVLTTPLLPPSLSNIWMTGMVNLPLV